MIPTLIYIVALFTPLQVASAVPEPVQAIEVDHVYTKLEVASIIAYEADKAGVDPELMLSIANAESGMNPNAVGDSGKAKNIFQFHEPTFDRFAKEMGEELDYDNTIDHIRLACWAFAQGEKYRNHWTTYHS